MRKICSLLLIICNTLSYSQTNKWDLNGNNSNTNDFIGTTNNQALVFKTDNSVRLKISPSGNVVIKDLESTGTGLVKANDNGRLGKIDYPNDATYFFNGTGNFSPLSSYIAWNINSNLITLDASKKVGIGVLNPTAQLEVTGIADFHGMVYIDSMQVGDSSLHFRSSPFAGFPDPITGLIISGAINEIYTDPSGPILGSDAGGKLFINCRPNSPGTVLNNRSGNVVIGAPVSTSGALGSLHKFYVVGSQRVSKGTGISSSFIDLIPTTTGINTSIEIGSITNTGQIDFKGAGNLGADYIGRIAYTDGTGFRVYTSSNTNPQLSILDNGKVTINGSTNNNLVFEKNSTFPSGGMMIQSQNDLGVRSGEIIFDATQYKFLNGPVKIGNTITANNSWTPACTTNCNYSLYVEHGILTERVKVAVFGTGDWSDYVFADDYKLLSLDSVELFINQNKHLPGVPSSEEMVANGNDLQTTDKILLEKIENLYLYIIQLNKEIEIIRSENFELKKIIQDEGR